MKKPPAEPGAVVASVDGWSAGLFRRRQHDDGVFVKCCFAGFAVDAVLDYQLLRRVGGRVATKTLVEARRPRPHPPRDPRLRRRPGLPSRNRPQLTRNQPPGPGTTALRTPNPTPSATTAPRGVRGSAPRSRHTGTAPGSRFPRAGDRQTVEVVIAYLNLTDHRNHHIAGLPGARPPEQI